MQYYDPGLWDALSGRVAEEIAIRQRQFCEGRWKTLEEAREKIGIMRGLAMVMEFAEAMQAEAQPDVEGEFDANTG